MIHWARLHDAHSLMRVWQHFFAFCLIVTMIKFSERFWWWEACCSGKWQGFDFLASIFSLATRNVRGISRQNHNRASLLYQDDDVWRKQLLSSNKYFQFIIFDTISFFQFWPRKKNYEQVLMTLKVKIIMGFKSVRHSVQLPSSTPKLKKHREGILPKNLGKKPFPWLAELKDPLLIFNQTTFHLRRYHLSKSNIPSNNDWKLVHRVRTFSGKLIILSYRLSKQR